VCWSPCTPAGRWIFSTIASRRRSQTGFAHPGAQIICRDRAGSSAEGGRLGAPDAIEVADRWHLLHNLSDAVDRIARGHRGCLRQQLDPENNQPPESSPPPAPTRIAGRRAEVTLLRHGEVHALLEQGLGLRTIGSQLGLQRNTVRRYARAATAEELLTQNPRRGSQLDPFIDYLATRWEQNCTNAVELAAEIRERGYRGSQRSVRDLVSTWRTNPVAPAAALKPPPTSRQVTALMMRPSQKLTEDEHAQLRNVLERCETLRTVNKLVSDFAGMARARHGQHLDRRLNAAQASEIPQMQRFAAGLLADYDAVRAGLTRPGAAARSKATSRESKRSRDRCTAARTSTCSADESSSHTDDTDDHGMCARARKLTPLTVGQREQGITMRIRAQDGWWAYRYPRCGSAVSVNARLAARRRTDSRRSR
jgi:transposase